jgi:Matrixin
MSRALSKQLGWSLRRNLRRAKLALRASGIRTVAAVIALSTAGVSAPAVAFETFGSKWDNPTFGTGAVVTWSFVNPGLALGTNSNLSFLSGTNSLGTGSLTDIRRIIDIDQGNGIGAFDAAVQRALNTWSAAANIQFIEIADSGAAFGDFALNSSQPDIRIGAYTFSSAFSGGAGFGPPGNDLFFPDPLAGDLALNDINNFVIATGAEGAPLPTGPGNLYLNDIEGLLLHEIGHTLGLGHSNVIAGVMCGFQSAGFDGSACDFTHVNHQLDADDALGIRTIYGSPVPLPAAVWLLGSALIGLGLAGRRMPI